MKRVHIGKKPASNQATSPDQWIAKRVPTTTTKRLTIDVPLALHKRIKMQCAMRGTQMADELRSILERSFTEQITDPETQNSVKP
jgi:hypothetical protein